MPESGVVLSRDTELIRAQLNPSHPSELCHGFGQILLLSNCSCSEGLELTPLRGLCPPSEAKVPFASGDPLSPPPPSPPVLLPTCSFTDGEEKIPV